MRSLIYILAILPLATGAAGPRIDAADIPAEIVAAAEREIPGMKISGAEVKDREGRRYYDVEGTRADGAEVELDVLQTPRGWEIVEIQRDIPWADVPIEARNVAVPALKNIVPARVIESRQTDGRIIYELFKPGAAHTPAFEIMVDRGKASLLTKAWPH